MPVRSWRGVSWALLAVVGWVAVAGAGPGAGVARAAVLKVACVGDSITEGSGLASPTTESYPARLARLVGTAHVVRNYGVSGRTLLKKGDYPYWREAAYTQSRAWEPDVVIIKLGSNDAKPYNWRHGTNFVADYEALVASYQTLASHPRIVLCTPAPVFGTGAFDIQPGVVATNIAPAVRDLASRLGLELMDFQVRLGGRTEWFPDRVHPNSRGAAVMAAMVFEALGFGGPSEGRPEPDLRVTPLTARRVRLEWPAQLGGWVVESGTNLGPNPMPPVVVEQVPYSDGERLRLTNSATGLRKFYRLWHP